MLKGQKRDFLYEESLWWKLRLPKDLAELTLFHIKFHAFRGIAKKGEPLDSSNYIADYLAAWFYNRAFWGLKQRAFCSLLVPWESKPRKTTLVGLEQMHGLSVDAVGKIFFISFSSDGRYLDNKGKWANGFGYTPHIFIWYLNMLIPIYFILAALSHLFTPRKFLYISSIVFTKGAALSDITRLSLNFNLWKTGETQVHPLKYHHGTTDKSTRHGRTNSQVSLLYDQTTWS